MLTVTHTVYNQQQAVGTARISCLQGSRECGLVTKHKCYQVRATATVAAPSPSLGL